MWINSCYITSIKEAELVQLFTPLVLEVPRHNCGPFDFQSAESGAVPRQLLIVIIRYLHLNREEGTALLEFPCNLREKKHTGYIR